MISTVEPVADKISLASESKSLLVLEEWINKLCDLYQISVEQYGNVLIAITEAVNNAIIHGNKNIANKKTDIEYNIDSQTITFTVFDEGTGFDFNDLPDPTSPENLEKPQGRGIFLMNHLADEVNFIDNGNIVQLKFSI
ncbi:MAG: ATP-binding protein [Bacteroidota bacterium]|nr:ATP-binding protein [Bacteroidota bacterium]|tara:strand:+ start:102 stop:518 length:417 start_codon:yes stop_codon:yes gene_type:complete